MSSEDTDDTWSHSESDAHRSRERDTETESQWTAEGADQPVTAGDIDSDWWYLVAGTAGLACFMIVLFFGGLVANTAGPGLPELLIFILILLLLPLFLLGIGSLVAIYYDAQAIQEADINWQPSAAHYLALGILLTPVVSALAYTLQRYRYLGWS